MAKKHPLADFFVVKNSRSEVTSSCAGISRASGYNNPIDFLGKTDFDMRCPATQLSEESIQQDISIIQSQSKKHYACIAMYHSMDMKVLSYTKEYDSGEVIVNLKEIKNGIFYQYSLQVINSIPRSLENNIHLIYEVISTYDQLTVRESEVLFLLLHDLPARQIAKNLNLSIRTIQHCCDRIRMKYYCETVSELVQKMIFLGYRKHIPHSLIVLVNA